MDDYEKKTNKLTRAPIGEKTVIVLESDELSKENLTIEDSGMFWEYELDDDRYPKFFVRLCSWDETKEHKTIFNLLNKMDCFCDTIRVTIELIENEDV